MSTPTPTPTPTPTSTPTPVPTNSGPLGPSYSYQQFINAPDRVGITSKATISALGNDISGLSSYKELLLQGTGKASASGKPLGNKFWYYTGSKCNAVTDPNGIAYTDPTLQNSVYRWLYVNNVPSGSLDGNRGLIPGMIEDLTSFTKLSIMDAFNTNSNPSCQSVSLEVIDSNNNSSTSSNYVALMDLQNLQECKPRAASALYDGLPLYDCATIQYKSSTKHKATVTYHKPAKPAKAKPLKQTKLDKKIDKAFSIKKHKKHGFTNMFENTDLSDNIIDQFFLLCICIAGIYLLYILHKRRK